MTETRLIGLRADNLQGWMAAIGTMLILARQGLNLNMRWDEVTPAVIGANADEIISALHAYHPNSDVLENLPVGYDGEKTSLDVTGGTVIFEKVIRQTHAAVTESKIREALMEVWKNSDPVTSLGWDSGALKQASKLAGNDQPAKAAHRGVVAGQWLAAESLTVTSYLRRVRKGKGGGREDPYRWVTWALPLDVVGVRAVVLAHSTEFGGVCYAADVYRNGKVGYFGPARTLIDRNGTGRFARAETADFSIVYDAGVPM